MASLRLRVLALNLPSSLGAFGPSLQDFRRGKVGSLASLAGLLIIVGSLQGRDQARLAAPGRPLAPSERARDTWKVSVVKEGHPDALRTNYTLPAKHIQNNLSVIYCEYSPQGSDQTCHSGVVAAVRRRKHGTLQMESQRSSGLLALTYEIQNYLK